MDLQRQTSRRLHEEHLAVLALLERFGQVLGRLATPPRLDDTGWNHLLPQLLSAIEHEISAHFDLEEQQLFPILRANGSGDLADLLAEEHVPIRAVSGPLLTLLKRARGTPPEAAQWTALRQLGLELVERLSTHAQMEEGSLVPMVDELLDDETDMDLWNNYVN